jgi:hypothetical protein
VPATRKTFSALLARLEPIRRGYDFRSKVDNVRTVLIMTRSHHVVSYLGPPLR